MCDLCTKHGEGKIWYKNAKNYADDLLADLERRRYIENFLTTAFSEGFQTLGRLETMERAEQVARVDEALCTGCGLWVSAVTSVRSKA